MSPQIPVRLIRQVLQPNQLFFGLVGQADLFDAHHVAFPRVPSPPRREIVQLLGAFSDGTCVVFTAERLQKLAGGKRSATTGTRKRNRLLPERVPEERHLASLQDATRFTFSGGAPYGDHRLISGILSG